jgi:Protein of unknown function (DUF2934)
LPKGGFAVNINPTKKTRAQAVSEPKLLEDQIHQRAYELYEARGRDDGHEPEDWLRAEEEILEQEVRPKAA